MKRKTIIALGLAAMLAISACAPEAQSGAPEDSGGVPAGEAVLSVDGETVYLDEFRYHLLSVMDTYAYYLGDFIDWGQDIDGLPPGEYFMRQAVENILRFRAVYRCADDYNIAFDEQADSDADAAIAEQIESAGGEAAFDQLLEQQGISRALYRYILITPDLYYKVLLSLYEEGGEYEPSPEAVRRYFDDFYLATKHVAVLFYDDEGYDLEEEALQSKKDQIAQAYDEYLADGDFERALALYNEDTYVNDETMHFSFGALPDIYYHTAEQLAVGAVSAVIDVGEIRCFIKRYALDDSFFEENYDALEEEYILYEFGLMLEGYMEQYPIEYEPAYSAIDPAAIYSEYFG